MSDYILTYSKIKFFPLEPVKEDIKIEDIAHSLSLMTRANGHCSHFYSVGQHSIHCYKEAKNRGYSERVQLGCLLHDASESYISDLTRPVKRNLPQYFTIEEKLQRIIYDYFGLGDLLDEERKQIEDVDDTLLHYEFETLMDFHMFDPSPYKSVEHDFSQRDFTSVEKEFIAIFNGLNYACSLRIRHE
ncbi:phosphohydrolase [Desulfosporosinus sp. Sb-LF]|uniref:phosphohydrolase n=1 Tax=Desulfosporosinus sp. Sb-LF TaxID=2560027 RepID=UPI00107F3F93|nr:phosphohydrolase [Desulfosporosinus sp. Sb-LF]TGE31413.1 phosphohydrolase [Desulfosporosinus sp. Sb-LF]